jgi:diacylglycerol kinase (ATP)
MSGLKSGWHEPAFRQEALLAVVLLPAAWWLGQSWAEVVLLVALTVAVLVVELLNTAVESVVDMASPEWHALAKRAKDTASAAVLLSLVVCGLAWVSALWRWVQPLLV